MTDDVLDGDVRDDRALLAAHVAGDPDAFGELVRRHRGRLWGVASRTLSNREDAADALQEALVKAYRGAASFRGDSSVATWMHRIVVNACLDRARHDGSRPSTPTEPDVLVTLPQPAGAGRDLGDAVALRLDVEQALATLPFDQRAALVVVDVLGHDVESAAAILGCPVGTVKSRCSRGRARLAPMLAHLRNRPDAASVEPAVGDRPADPMHATSSDGGDQT